MDWNGYDRQRESKVYASVTRGRSPVR